MKGTCGTLLGRAPMGTNPWVSRRSYLLLGKSKSQTSHGSALEDLQPPVLKRGVSLWAYVLQLSRPDLGSMPLKTPGFVQV